MTGNHPLGNAKTHFNRGVSRYELGKLKEAIVDFSAVIALDKKYAPAYFYRGLARACLDETADAVADFTSVIVIDKKHATAYYNRNFSISSGR